MTMAELKVDGMSCGHCAQAVTESLQKLRGVERAQVELDSGRARVQYDEKTTEVQEMIAAVREAGYEAQREG